MTVRAYRHLDGIMVTASSRAEFALGRYSVTDGLMKACNAQSNGAFKAVYWERPPDRVCNFDYLFREPVTQ